MTVARKTTFLSFFFWGKKKERVRFIIITRWSKTTPFGLSRLSSFFLSHKEKKEGKEGKNAKIIDKCCKVQNKGREGMFPFPWQTVSVGRQKNARGENIGKCSAWTWCECQLTFLKQRCGRRRKKDKKWKTFYSRISRLLFHDRKKCSKRFQNWTEKGIKTGKE